MTFVDAHVYVHAHVSMNNAGAEQGQPHSQCDVLRTPHSSVERAPQSRRFGIGLTHVDNINLDSPKLSWNHMNNNSNSNSNKTSNNKYTGTDFTQF